MNPSDDDRAQTFLVARNPDPVSSLPYVVRLPLPDGPLLKVRETWPRTAKVYCHRAEGWPQDAEILEEVPIRSCVRRGVAIDLVLDRARENRSQFVFTQMQGGGKASSGSPPAPLVRPAPASAPHPAGCRPSPARHPRRYPGALPLPLRPPPSHHPAPGSLGRRLSRGAR